MAQKITPKSAELSEGISSDIAEQLFGKYLETEATRQKIISVTNECLRDIDVVNRVKQYAGEEMDKRLFRSAQYWITVVVTALITGGLSAAVALVFNRA